MKKHVLSVDKAESLRRHLAVWTKSNMPKDRVLKVTFEVVDRTPVLLVPKNKQKVRLLPLEDFLVIQPWKIEGLPARIKNAIYDHATRLGSNHVPFWLQSVRALVLGHKVVGAPWKQDENDLQKYRGIGGKGFRVLESILAQYGLTLGMSVKELETLIRKSK